LRQPTGRFTCQTKLCSDCANVLLKNGWPVAELDRLSDNVSKAFECGASVSHVQRLDVSIVASRSESPSTRANLAAFWREVGHRTILAVVSAQETYEELVRGCFGAINGRNALLACLAARALVEHAASYCNLSSSLAIKREFVESQVVPELNADDHEAPPSSAFDYDILRELVLFQFGTRVLPDGSLPDTAQEWREWRERCVYPTKQERKDAHVAPPFVKVVLDATQSCQKNCMTLLEKLEKQPQYACIQVLYAILSEFCHPNSANRELGFSSHGIQTDKLVFERDRTDYWTPARKRALEASICAVGLATELHVQSWNAVREFLAALAAIGSPGN